MKKREQSDKKKIAFEIIAVAVILLVGIFIRAYHFGMIPVGVHQDEAMAAVDAKALAEHGTDRFGMRYPVHFTAWVAGQMSVFLSYCMIPFIKVLGFSVVSIRLPMLIISCVGLLMLYLVGRKLCNPFLGYVVLIMGCICPWHYMQSRWSLDCNMFPHMFLIGFVLLFYGLQKKGSLFCSMIFFGLCSYCYGIANYSVPVFLLVAAVVLFRNKFVKIKDIIISVLIYILVALPEFLCMFLTMFGFDSIETPLFTIPSFQQSKRGGDILFLNFSLEQLLENIKDLIAVVWGKGDFAVGNTIVEVGPLYRFTFVFFVIGFVVICFRLGKMKEQKEKALYILLLAWFFMGAWAGLMTSGIVMHRVNVIFYPVLVISSVGIKWCIEKYKWLVIPIGGLYAVSAIFFAYMYFRDWADRSRDYYYDSYVNALYYAKTLECDSYYITPDPQGAGVKEVGQILTMFCHEIDAEYYQGITNVCDGQERLPYEERYHFLTADEDIVAANEDRSVVYLIGGDRMHLFSEEEYEWESFYDVYYVVRQRAE